MAFVLVVIFFSIETGSIHHVSRSTSANTGFAPSQQTGDTLPIQVISGTITSSPGPTPSAMSTVCSAPWQLEVGHAYFTLKNFFNVSVNLLM